MAAPIPQSLFRNDYAKLSRQIESFIADYVSASNSRGIVIGLSGGLDSSVAVKLAVQALGERRVYGLILPTESTPGQDVQDAAALARQLKMKYRLVSLSPIIARFSRILTRGNKKALGNLTARIRMAILYHEAAVRAFLVCGTSDKSELLIGYFTKYGDGASDLMPLAGLYKTQVRELGRHLMLPQTIIDKKSSPRLWKGQMAETELGVSYEVIDAVLHLLEKRMSVSQICKTLEQEKETVSGIRSMVESSAHKRVAASSPEKITTKREK